MARVSKLANPEFAKAVAEAYINGDSRAEMAELFGAHKDTITDWTRDPRVQAHAARLAQERVLRITRKIDTEIETRVADADEMDTELLLKIRKEFLDRSLKIDLANAKDDPGTMSDMIDALEANPELAQQLKESFK
jgi:transposase